MDSPHELPAGRSMYFKLFIAAVFVAGGLLLYFWKTRTTQPATASIDDLKFPVTVVFSKASSYVHRDAEDLGTMSMQAVVMHETPPYLIDNELHLFQLDELKSTKNSMQIMLSAGTGLTPVTFQLKPLRDDAHAEARRLLACLIGPEMPDEEIEALEKRIQSAGTLEEILGKD